MRWSRLCHCRRSWRSANRCPFTPADVTFGHPNLTDSHSPEIIASVSHVETQPLSISASWTWQTRICLKGVLGLSAVVDCTLAHVHSADQSQFSCTLITMDQQCIQPACVLNLLCKLAGGKLKAGFGEGDHSADCHQSPAAGSRARAA